jgi:hypothetical protein
MTLAKMRPHDRPHSEPESREFWRGKFSFGRTAAACGEMPDFIYRRLIKATVIAKQMAKIVKMPNAAGKWPKNRHAPKAEMTS